MEPRLPGEGLIATGIEDLERRIESVASLVVSIGHPRLRRLGLQLPPPIAPDPEHRLYRTLAEADPAAAHSRYNALIRRLVGYERAAGCVS